ncbi:hypothetical protein [Saccharothrix syringae]|uniref:Tetratricopeptide repeat protein n=1 Tax=Saccharothrix syringae TaxID=103733 RepID=A0A5Q0H2I8_SACSY|nr:hypothetical protein [Saccharothrix syringae]QFZ20428.1 hypothetical protein EKG83_26105 [Saccharothrix syringae]
MSPAAEGPWDDVAVLAASLAQQWAATPAEVPAERMRRLRDLTEHLADRAPTSPEVAGLLHAACDFYARAGQHRLAHGMGLRALAVWRARADTAPSTATPIPATVAGYRDALHALARLHRAVGVLHEVADALEEFLELLQLLQVPDELLRAWALRELGAVMLEVGRPDAADHHLTRAAQLYRDLRGHRLRFSAAAAAEHAVCLVLLGWAQPDQAGRERHFTAARAAVSVAGPAARTGGPDPVAAMTATDPTAAAAMLAEFGTPAWPAPVITGTGRPDPLTAPGP